MSEQGSERVHSFFKLRMLYHRRSQEAGLCGVSPITERGTTQIRVKAPKCWLSVKLKSVIELRQQGGRLRSSHPSKIA
jgi:hypothetical protein